MFSQTSVFNCFPSLKISCICVRYGTIIAKDIKSLTLLSYDREGIIFELRKSKAAYSMKIRSVELKHFKRFHHFKIELPDNIKLVILAGPNGTGKSSLFEGFNFWTPMGVNKNPGWDDSYYPKVGEPDIPKVAWTQHVEY